MIDKQELYCICFLSSALLVSAGLAGGCVEEETSAFSHPSTINSLRVLGIKADPPEIALPAPDSKGEGILKKTSLLTSLVASPGFLDNPAKRSSVLYFACTPNLEDSDDSCIQGDSWQDHPVALLEKTISHISCTPGNSSSYELGIGKVGEFSFSGIDSCDATGCSAARIQLDSAISLSTPTYTIPDNLRLNELPSNHPRRFLGIKVSILAFAIDAAPEELVSGSDWCAALANVPNQLKTTLKDRKQVITVKYIHIRGPDSDDAPNQNPSIEGIEEFERTDYGIRYEPKFIETAIDNESFGQTFTLRDSNGQPLETAQEHWRFSWFTTSGSIHGGYWIPLASPSPTRAQIYLVVRDERGGLEWATKKIAIP